MATASKKEEEDYRARITIMLGIAKFLLLQALAFRGHDESSSSKNKGNFLEMLKWYKEKDEKAAKLLDNAPGNNLMTSPKIQKQLCKACAQMTTKAIIDDIGGRQFAMLVDEARDASIKEQMAVVLRYVNNKGQVIERFLGLQRRILDENPYAFYIHCCAHQLQLVVVSVAKCYSLFWISLTTSL
ncbi:uncharacterized protein LOC133911654 [Phragmites australis]|uniref:uncharacterized protein LOC133911654 n=1 Tax=Phragmites australis TaxID=29695 RepID=UPI002D78AD18|nr:uncharacterized protein LOC133911654 [Phragmites australis]